jgi:hypothetical protein
MEDSTCQIERTIHSQGEAAMTFDEIRTGIMGLSAEDQKKIILEIVPQLWPKACADDACVQRMRTLVDDAVINKYREEHLGNI